MSNRSEELQLTMHRTVRLAGAADAAAGADRSVSQSASLAAVVSRLPYPQTHRTVHQAPVAELQRSQSETVRAR